ncbi:MAG: BrnA antitoxin family protein [Desulfovibrio sp.]|nr:BrnA antitoxin family protein [Desulfovibrio sp.]
MSAQTGTDWERLRNMTDDEAHANALADSDSPPLTDDQLKGAVRLGDIPGKTIMDKLANARRRRKVVVTARFDADVMEYYRAKGKGYQSAMNAALRACMEAGQETLAR